MDAERGPDKLIMVLYLSKFYEMFRNSTQSNTGRAFHTTAPQKKQMNFESLHLGCISNVVLLKSLKFVINILIFWIYLKKNLHLKF